MKTINDLREHLFATLDALRDKHSPMDVDRARAVSEVAKQMIDSAKVEVDFIRATSGFASAFIAPPATVAATAAVPELPPGITGIRQHRIAG